MKELIADFGTDHWYQLDGYFNGGTAPWLAASEVDDANRVSAAEVRSFYDCHSALCAALLLLVFFTQRTEPASQKCANVKCEL
jgi:hypothetical protein